MDDGKETGAGEAADAGGVGSGCTRSTTLTVSPLLQPTRKIAQTGYNSARKKQNGVRNSLAGSVNQ